jgi:hypothetical protein
MITEAFPIENKDIVAFSRREKDGFVTKILSDLPGGTKLLNSTAEEILKLCDGRNTIEIIKNTLCERYPNIKKKEISKDLTQTLLILNRNNLIKWKDNQDPFKVESNIFEIRHDDHIRTFRADESFYHDIHAFLKKCGIIGKNMGKEKNYIGICSSLLRSNIYEELTLRMRIFNYTEIFYFLEQDDELIGMLSVLDDYPISKRGIISLLTLKDNEKKNDQITFLFDILKKDSINKFDKIKFSIASTLNNIDYYLDCLKNIGFTIEGKLVDEYNKGETEIVLGMSLPR